MIKREMAVKKAIASVLGAALIVLSPGLEFWAHAAALFEAGPAATSPAYPLGLPTADPAAGTSRPGPDSAALGAAPLLQGHTFRSMFSRRGLALPAQKGSPAPSFIDRELPKHGAVPVLEAAREAAGQAEEALGSGRESPAEASQQAGRPFDRTKLPGLSPVQVLSALSPSRAFNAVAPRSPAQVAVTLRGRIPGGAQTKSFLSSLLKDLRRRYRFDGYPIDSPRQDAYEIVGLVPVAKARLLEKDPRFKVEVHKAMSWPQQIRSASRAEQHRPAVNDEKRARAPKEGDDLPKLDPSEPTYGFPTIKSILLSSLVLGSIFGAFMAFVPFLVSPFIPFISLLGAYSVSVDRAGGTPIDAMHLKRSRMGFLMIALGSLAGGIWGHIHPFIEGINPDEISLWWTALAAVPSALVSAFASDALNRMGQHRRGRSRKASGGSGNSTALRSEKGKAELPATLLLAAIAALAVVAVPVLAGAASSGLLLAGAQVLIGTILGALIGYLVGHFFYSPEAWHGWGNFLIFGYTIVGAFVGLVGGAMFAAHLSGPALAAFLAGALVVGIPSYLVAHYRYGVGGGNYGNPDEVILQALTVALPCAALGGVLGLIVAPHFLAGHSAAAAASAASAIPFLAWPRKDGEREHMGNSVAAVRGGGTNGEKGSAGAVWALLAAGAAASVGFGLLLAKVVPVLAAAVFSPPVAAVVPWLIFAAAIPGGLLYARKNLGFMFGPTNRPQIALGLAAALTGLGGLIGLTSFNRIAPAAAPAGTPVKVREFASPQPHGSYENVALSPDGKLLYVADAYGFVRVYEVGTGKEQEPFPTVDNSLVDVAASRDGRLVAGAYFDKTARVWEAATRKELYKFEHSEFVFSVAFSPDSKRLYAGPFEGSPRVYDLETGKEVVKLDAVPDVGPHSFLSLAPSPDGKYLFASSDASAAFLWDLGTGRIVGKFPGPDVWVWSAAVSPDGKYLFTGHHHIALMWDLATGKQVRTFFGHSGLVGSIKVSPDGKRLYTGGEIISNDDRTARAWDIATGKELAVYPHPGDVLGLDLSQDGKRLFTGGIEVATEWKTPGNGVVAGPHSNTRIMSDTALAAVLAAAGFAAGFQLGPLILDGLVKLWNLPKVIGERMGLAAGQFLNDLSAWMAALNP